MKRFGNGAHLNSTNDECGPPAVRTQHGPGKDSHDESEDQRRTMSVTSTVGGCGMPPGEGGSAGAVTFVTMPLQQQHP